MDMKFYDDADIELQLHELQGTTDGTIRSGIQIVCIS